MARPGAFGLVRPAFAAEASTCRRASPGAWRRRPLSRCPGRSGCRPPPRAPPAAPAPTLSSGASASCLSSLRCRASRPCTTSRRFSSPSGTRGRTASASIPSSARPSAARGASWRCPTRRAATSSPRSPRPRRRRVVVHNGVEPETPAARAPAPHGGRPYVLYVGTLEPRKNVSRLVAAMESIWDRRPDFPDLVLAGGDGWGMEGFTERVARSRHAARVARVGYLGPGERARWLAGARVFAYPEPLRGLRPPAPRGDGSGHARRGLVGVVAAGGDGRRRPPARPRERPRHRGGAGAGARRRGFPAPRGGGGPAARAHASRGRPRPRRRAALFEEALS